MEFDPRPSRSGRSGWHVAALAVAFCIALLLGVALL